MIPLSFYQKEDVIQIGKELLGKKLITVDSKNQLTSGIIVETESYKGAEDRACHAYQNRRTPRTEPMFHNGGISYVYLCYGIHYLFNVVTHKIDTPHAVLIRAIEPVDGIDWMLQRRNKKRVDRSLTAGPGALTQALGIDLSFNKKSLLSSEIWIEEGTFIREENIIATPRVGVSYAKEDALLPYRFRILKNSWTSLAK